MGRHLQLPCTMTDLLCAAWQTRVPLVMGIWGPKGQGKSFQAELVFKKLG